MTRTFRIVAFAAGLALFAWLIARVGPASLLENAERAGWVIFPVVLVYALVYACYAAAWWVVIGNVPRRPSFGKIFAITISGFAFNYLTPFVALGGEPYKAASVSGAIGGRSATATVVAYNVLHTVSHLLIWLGAVAVAWVMLPRTPVLTAVLVFVGLVVIGLLGIFFAARRTGLLGPILGILTRLPFGKRFVAAMERHRGGIAAIDAQIADFLSKRPGRFAIALGLDTLGRLAGMLEFWLIFQAVGDAAPFWKVYLVGSLTTIILNLFFFLPFEMGSREGSMYFLFPLLGLSPAVGIFTVIVNRIREIVWIAAGLGIVGFRTRIVSEPKSADPKNAEPNDPEPDRDELRVGT